MTVSRWIQNNTHSLHGKTVAVNGATGGLGRELCHHLAGLGASLVLLDRNQDKSHRLAKELKGHYPELSVRHVTADLEDMVSVKQAVLSLEQIGIDGLILNAGAYSIPRHTTSIGYDNVYQINFIAPYYLARTLLPHIQGRGGRIVAVGSIAHRYSKTDAQDIDFSGRKQASLVYGNAKRYLMYSLYNTDGVSITHPGITLTGITAHYPAWLYALIKYPMKLLFMPPKKASLSILYGLFHNTHKSWLGPCLLDIWGFPCQRHLRSARPDEIARIQATAEHILKNLQT